MKLLPDEKIARAFALAAADGDTWNFYEAVTSRSPPGTAELCMHADELMARYFEMAARVLKLEPDLIAHETSDV